MSNAHVYPRHLSEKPRKTWCPIANEKAHGAGLRVSTHIESAADFHNALIAGVDEINHMAGFRSLSHVEPHSPSEFETSEADAELAAKRGRFVVTTIRNQQADEKLQRQQDSLNSRNLLMLLKHHVKVALGSDSYRDDTLPEALYLYGLHVLDNRTLLNAETIFPGRRIGQLKDGYEASFLALETNPLDDFTSVERIKLRVKQGQILQVTNNRSDASAGHSQS